MPLDLAKTRVDAADELSRIEPRRDYSQSETVVALLSFDLIGCTWDWCEEIGKTRK